jgi:hypothetical protein
MKYLEVWADEDMRVADRKSGLDNVGQADGDRGCINRILEEKQLPVKTNLFQDLIS